MNIPTSTFVASVFLAGFVIYATLRLAEYAFRELSRKGKVRVIWWDQDSKSARISFHDRKDGKVTAGKGDAARTYILQGECVMGGEYPTVLLHPVHGWNFKAPTNAETVDKELRLAALAVSNPESYHKAMARHEWSDTLNANEEKENPWAKNAPIIVLGAIIIVVGLFGVLGFVAYKVANATGGA